ncbi:MFS transporter [Limibacillus sp. MBR-115]|uniref:MFS transporter n=1 Tax=Limibacillus sp. MBR-115 TaxID=3156465 RepID=UPI0033924841
MRRGFLIGTKWPALLLLALSEVAAMALWFSASAVLPVLTAQYDLSPFQQSLFTSAVQVGFVCGSLVSAFFGLADRLDARRFFSGAAIIAALANAGLLLVEPTSPIVPLFRFITGAAMAGVYPVGMKMAASWAKGDMGLLVGLLVGALTLGSAAPHLFNAMGGLDWRFTLGTASMSAVAAAVSIHFFTMGPNVTAAPRFRPDNMLWAWRIKPLRLANFGYLGHMWELYAMWAWIGVFLSASFELWGAGNGNVGDDSATAAKLATFATIGAGAVGCLAGGYLADRIGRTALTMAAMTVSGVCALTVGLLFGASPWLLVPLCIVWGISIVADSAQFSAAVAELSNRFLVGTMLTLQTAVGFTLTLVTIHLMPVWVESLGWHYAFMPLAIGPFLGVVAMWRLRLHRDSHRMAGGRR